MVGLAVVSRKGYQSLMTLPNQETILDLMTENLKKLYESNNCIRSIIFRYHHRILEPCMNQLTPTTPRVFIQ